MRRLALALLLASPAVAVEPGTVVSGTIISSDVSAVSVTVYPDDLAMVTETRSVSLPAGRSTIAFTGVSDRIVPKSVVLRSFTGVSLERNFDYDLLGRAALFEGAVGENIRLTRIDTSSGQTFSEDAEIVSADADNGVIVRTERGLEGLYCSGLGVRAGFDGIPLGLRAEPTFSIEVDAETAGEQVVELSYLTSGMGWEADYRLDVDGEASDLLGWLSLRNDTNMRFEDADLGVVAGDVAREGDTQPVEVRSDPLRAACYPIGSTKRGIPVTGAPPPPPPPPLMLMRQSEAAFDAASADEIIVTGARVQKAIREDFADYKLYRAPRPVTLAAHQTKQIAFVSAAGVEAEQVFYLSLDDGVGETPQPLAVRYSLDNSPDGELAEPLPQGTVRVFAESPSLGPVYVGEDSIRDLPVDQPVEVVAGRSPTVFVQRLDNRDRRVTMEFTNANAGDAVVVMDTRYEPKIRVRGGERVSDKDIPTFRVVVPGNGSKQVTVTRPRG